MAGRHVSSALMFMLISYSTNHEIYTLSLHDALPISMTTSVRDLQERSFGATLRRDAWWIAPALTAQRGADRKSTRLNSSHANISYAVFCLKKKKNTMHYIVHSTKNY